MGRAKTRNLRIINGPKTSSKKRASKSFVPAHLKGKNWDHVDVQEGVNLVPGCTVMLKSDIEVSPDPITENFRVGIARRTKRDAGEQFECCGAELGIYAGCRRFNIPSTYRDPHYWRSKHNVPGMLVICHIFIFGGQPLILDPDLVTMIAAPDEDIDEDVDDDSNDGIVDEK